MTTQLTAINWAKVLTIGMVVVLMLIHGLPGQRQILYACMHISYCSWWLLEQRFYPERRRQIFTEPVGTWGFLAALLVIGVFYALPAFLAFANPADLSVAATATAIPLFYFGSLINTSADVQKMTAKANGVGLVSDGIWSQVRHVNYTGDLMRYLSFAVIAGSPWAFLVPGSIAILYIQRISTKERSMSQKYDDFETYRQQSNRLLPGFW
ncbi:DUF1295 domain-containing protein [Synechococcus sp. RSCCF101]|uniref:methyltransferase family protein n=1 Tax=Synechococcus sp. RSCCF101 TaxID=2511069 RepID=UPI00124650BB|nr:DUF1295 domain-containing protein [Synechococcus sp. RSCCF101]QEY31248.1 DUF1295 domain-containing protein [Synechococcus sp. RSCCF101]